MRPVLSHAQFEEFKRVLPELPRENLVIDLTCFEASLLCLNSLKETNNIHNTLHQPANPTSTPPTLAPDTRTPGSCLLNTKS